MTTTGSHAAARPDAGDVDSEAEYDARLAAALLAGDARAAVTAWNRFSPLVTSVLRRHAGDTGDQQDLRQEVFLRFFARIRELRNPHALRNFLFGICLGIAQNERRRAKAHRWIQLTSNGELPERTIAPADIEAREATRRLLHAVADLGDRDRSLFVVRYVEKLDLENIALVMGRPLSTSKRHLARAVRRIDSRMRRDPLLMEYVDRQPARARAA